MTSKLPYVINILKNLIMQRSAYRFFIRDWRSLGDLTHCATAVSTLRYSVNLQPVVMERPTGRRIMVIAPHPDDEMIGPGGTLIKAIDTGALVRVVYLTKGRRGLGDTLQVEAREAANLVGYETVFLEHCSRDIALSRELINSIRAEIDSFAPETLFLPFLCDDHDDHRRAGHAVYLSHCQQPIKSIEVWAYQVYTCVIPNVVVDITNVELRKRQAIRCWKSQYRSRHWDHYALGMNAYNSRFLCTKGDPRFAETFFVLPISDYFEFCKSYYEQPSDIIYYTSNYE